VARRAVLRALRAMPGLPEVLRAFPRQPGAAAGGAVAYYTLLSLVPLLVLT
jgi:uncharacterized BrkB/YihY/UPF0761 family membrane protein